MVYSSLCTEISLSLNFLNSIIRSEMSNFTFIKAYRRRRSSDKLWIDLQLLHSQKWNSPEFPSIFRSILGHKSIITIVKFVKISLLNSGDRACRNLNKVVTVNNNVPKYIYILMVLKRTESTKCRHSNFIIIKSCYCQKLFHNTNKKSK